jgi:DNA-binding response OmpR family regulator
MGLSQGKPLSLLVVDDEETVCRLLERYFGADGHVVHLAMTGLQALEQLRTHRYDVCLVDKNLPDVSGVQVASVARARGPDSVIVLLTGYASIGSAAELIGVADEYLTKPFELSVLRDTVQTLLRRRATRPALAPSSGTGPSQVFVLVSTPEDSALLTTALSTLSVNFEVGSQLPMLAPSLVVMAAGLATFAVRKAIWTWQTHAQLRLVMIVDPNSIGDTISAVALGATHRIKRPYDVPAARAVLREVLR